LRRSFFSTGFSFFPSRLISAAASPLHFPFRFTGFRRTFSSSSSSSSTESINQQKPQEPKQKEQKQQQQDEEEPQLSHLILTRLFELGFLSLAAYAIYSTYQYFTDFPIPCQKYVLLCLFHCLVPCSHPRFFSFLSSSLLLLSLPVRSKYWKQILVSRPC
jgi:hypothetical protein